MLSILLAILKFIGILLLSIVLLFILIISIILISPLKYHLTGIKQEVLKGDFALQWLFGLVRIKGMYLHGHEPDITVKVLWFTLFGEKKEKKKVRKKKKRPVPQPMNTEGAVVAREKSATVKKQPSQGIYVAEPTPPEAERKQPQPLQEEIPEPPQGNMEDPLPPKPRVRRVKVSTIQEVPEDISLEKESQDFFTGEPETDESPSNMDKLRYYKKKFDEIEGKREIFLALKKLLKRLIKGILPNHLFLKATLGLGDPTYTGYLMGLVGILTAKFGNNIQVKGDFTRLVAEDIEIKIKGKIVMGSFVYALLGFVWTKPVRRILIKLWKGRKQNGKRF